MGIMYKFFFIKHDIHVSTAWSTGARAGFGPKVSHYSALVSQKRDARVTFPPFSWGTILPLIGQTAHGRMTGIIVLTVWPIRGNFVPHENGGKVTLASLF